MNERTKFGLVGKNISYSFSKKYFGDKFKKEGLTTLTYRNFDLPEIEEFPFILYQRKDEFRGLNVTIPYKESIMRYLDGISDEASEIGAVNTIKITDGNKLMGYNTDIYGFKKAIEPLLKSHHKKALILGTGGASKAVKFALRKLGIEVKEVSRTPKNDLITYQELNEEQLRMYPIIVNCSPVGTFPQVHEAPNIPYQFLNDKNLLFDLIYNPSETTFLQRGREAGAATKNGYEMLQLQAEKAWEIWNS